MRDTLTATKSNGKFGQTLRGLLERNRIEGRKPDSIRSLARAMGAGDDARVTASKRNLHRWISGGIKPSPDSIESVACALGVSPSVLSEDDDEEADPVMREAFALFVDLMDRLQAHREKQRTPA